MVCMQIYCCILLVCMQFYYRMFVCMLLPYSISWYAFLLAASCRLTCTFYRILLVRMQFCYRILWTVFIVTHCVLMFLHNVVWICVIFNSFTWSYVSWFHIQLTLHSYSIKHSWGSGLGPGPQSGSSPCYRSNMSQLSSPANFHAPISLLPSRQARALGGATPGPRLWEGEVYTCI